MSEQESTLDEFTEEVRGETKEENVQEWTRHPISEISEWTDAGGTPRTSNEDYWEGDIPWVQTGELTKRHITSTEKHITEVGLQDSTAKRFPPGTLLVGMYGEPTVGESALLEIEATTNQACCGVFPDTDVVNPEFLHQMLQYEKPRLYSLRAGSGQQNIRQGIIRKFEIDVPPLKEQRKIASVLYTVDQAIQKTEELIEQTERVHRGLIQDLLNDGIGEVPKRETDSRFGQLPESWELRPLKEIGKIAGRTAPEKDETDCWGGDIPWATPSEITSLEGPSISDTEEHLTELALEKVSSNLLPPGSVLLTTRATIGECAVNTVEMTTNQGFKNFVPGDEIDTWYAYYRLEYEGEYLASLSKGSTFPEVGKDTVENFVIPVPPLEEQEEIGERLRSVDDMILSYKSNKDQLERLKQGLMQDLLSGEVRTHDKDIEILDDVLQHG